MSDTKNVFTPDTGGHDTDGQGKPARTILDLRNEITSCRDDVENAVAALEELREAARPIE